MPFVIGSSSGFGPSAIQIRNLLKLHASSKYPRAGLAACMVFAVVQHALVSGHQAIGEVHEAECFFLASANPSD